MRRSFRLPVVVAIGVWLLAPRAAAADQWPTDVASYQMRVDLLPEAHQLRGEETLRYRNPSPDTLAELYFHLYLNAFRQPDTLWQRERGERIDPAFPGWIRVERLALEDGTDVLAGSAQDETGTVLRVPLPRPLAAGEELALRVAWTSQLPRAIARTGFVGDLVFAGQWYPKLAVYDPHHGGWDREPWHGNAEFFADFGSYDLAVTAPSGLTVVANGVPVGRSDGADGRATWQARAEHVTDVAWFAAPRLASAQRQVGATQVAIYAPPALEGWLPRYLDAAQLALERFGDWYGAYPWPRLTILLPPDDAGAIGGMEYPTLVTTDAPLETPPGLDVLLPEVVTVHEIAHQWFPMQVQSNEAAEPWLDEGFADYLTTRALESRFPRDATFLASPPARMGYRTLHQLDYFASAGSAVVARRAWDYTPGQYGAAVYSKGSLALRTVQGYLGEERMLAAMRLYVGRWRWGHPVSADFYAAVEEASGERLDWLLGPLFTSADVLEFRVDALETQPAVGGYATRIQVSSPGHLRLPVELAVDFADGSEQRLRWDGREQQATLEVRSAGPAVAARLDPERQLPVELNPLDDSLRLQPAAEDVTAVVRWLGDVQWLARLAGLFG